MRKLRWEMFPPFLLTLYFILFYYSYNFFKVETGDLPAVIIIGLLVTGLGFAISSFILRNFQRAVFVMSLLVILFTSAGALVRPLVMRSAVDDGVVAGNAEKLMQGGLLLAGLLIVEQVLGFAQMYAMQVAGARAFLLQRIVKVHVGGWHRRRRGTHAECSHQSWRWYGSRESTIARWTREARPRRRGRSC